MSLSDYEAVFGRYHDGTPYVYLGVPGASGPVSLEEARHLLTLLGHALADAEHHLEAGQPLTGDPRKILRP